MIGGRKGQQIITKEREGPSLSLSQIEPGIKGKAITKSSPPLSSFCISLLKEITPSYHYPPSLLHGEKNSNEGESRGLRREEGAETLKKR